MSIVSASEPAIPEAAIRLEAVHKYYSIASRRLHVLRGCDLSLRAGEFAAITGPSGCGKTSLLFLLAGLDVANEGRVVVGGADLRTLSIDARARWRSQQIGLVFQNYLLLPHLNACQNVMLPLVLSESSRSARREIAQAALDLVGLADRADHRPSQLSGGEQQRVAIARAIANDAPLLLCDEPTGNLSEAASRSTFELLAGLNHETGKTVIVVTHDMTMAALTQRTLQLDDGKLRG
jgi:putative ABC transport system ATP-binding protein